MNINTILEEFYREFGHIQAVKNEISGNSYKTFEQFLTDQIRKAFEEVKPNNDDYCEEGLEYEQELNKNITNFFNKV